jgi:hypothetical protein
MLAALVAAGGLWLGPWKHRWLESRLMTERMRQWHFQFMVRHLEQIEASWGDQNAIANFRKERNLWLDDFFMAYEGRLDAQVESLASEPGANGTWLHQPSTYHVHGPVFHDICQAYERLRFDHQYSYAVWKLRKSTDQPFWRFLKWPPTCQLAALSTAASVCFVGALLFSGALVYGHAFGMQEDVELRVRTGAIVVAVIGAALRTLQAGFAPDKEIERYSDYRARTSQLWDRFRRTSDPKEKLRLMEEMEEAAVDEMKGFLRTHYNANFVLA